MPKQTILLAVDKFASTSCLNDWAATAYDQDFHLSVLVIAIAPPMPTAAYGGMPYGGIVITDEWQENITADAKALSDKADEIETLFADKGISADVRGLHCELAVIDDEVATAAMVSDLATFPDHHGLDPTALEKITSGLLFQSPIATILHSSKPESVLTPNKVFLALKSGMPAARAIHLALPQLQQAQEVMIGIIDPDMHASRDGEDAGAEVAAWLSRHGCKVTLQQLPRGSKSIADSIKSHAMEFGADLIVMGAYGHSKLRQRIFGGTTHDMIADCKIPILLAH